MNAKRTLVSFLAIATLLFLATTVSALAFAPLEADGSALIADGSATVEINGIGVTDPNTISVTAGDTITIKVEFTAVENLAVEDDETSASKVRIKAELEGEEGTSTSTTSYFDVVQEKTYVKTLTLEVPEVDEDFTSEDMTLTLKIWNADFESEADITLTVQRESYQVSVRSVLVSSSVAAGQTSPIEVVLENTGYNDLEDLYVTVRIPELGVERTAYFGDLLVTPSTGDDDSVRIYLEVPYKVASGIYTLEVEVYNDDFSDVTGEEVTVTNGFPEVVLKSGDNLLVLNPTNSMKVYKVVYPSAELLIVVEAGSSKLVPIETLGEEYNFDVFVFEGEELAGTVNFSGISESNELTSPVVLLTIILAVIFVVLLVVMIVLITKKPEKAEEFGESYY